MPLRRNILIFHMGALGDFVLTWPLALALGRLFPQSRVFYVTHGQKGALAARALGVEYQDVESGWHHLFADASALPAPCRRLLESAHTAVTFAADPGGRWVENVRQAAPEAEVMALSPKPPEDFAGHATDHLLNQLRPWPAAEEAVRQILRSVAARGVGLSRPPAPTDQAPVVIHPGSGSPDKCWPAEKFAELARLLRADGRTVRVLLGEAEMERWGDRAGDAFAAAGAEVHQPGDLLRLLDQLSRAQAFVGNDSGPGHLAGVVGTPTLCLFGPTDPARWKPLGPRVAVLRAGPLESLDVQAVYNQLNELVRGPEAGA